ncbi:MAG: CDP-diacylglycerol--serine O-phosphatidyltransferase [Nanobdellota archaeon]
MNLWQKNQIPTWLTLGNLTGGFLAILAIIDNNIPFAIGLIGIALFFDLIDGYVARKYGWQSQMGIELDSLADAVSFVIVPSLLTYFILLDGLNPIPSIFMAGCGILRLAKFNVTKGKDHFEGVPTPIHTIFIVALLFLNLPLWVLIPLVIVSSYSMISELKYPALKKGHFQRYKRYGLIVAIIVASIIVVSRFIPLGLILTSGTIYVIFLLLLIQLNCDKKLKKRMPATLFTVGFIVSVGFAYFTLTFVMPLLYVIVFAPLIQTAIDGKWN